MTALRLLVLATITTILAITLGNLSSPAVTAIWVGGGLFLTFTLRGWLYPSSGNDPLFGSFKEPPPPFSSEQKNWLDQNYATFQTARGLFARTEHYYKLRDYIDLWESKLRHRGAPAPEKQQIRWRQLIQGHWGEPSPTPAQMQWYLQTFLATGSTLMIISLFYQVAHPLLR